MRVLVLGGSGMLGHKVFDVLNRQFETYASFHTTDGAWAEFPMYVDCPRVIVNVNALDFDSVARAITNTRPAAIVNCIGVVKQLKSANDPVSCISINALFPHRLAELCATTGARLIHMSSDCVFSGTRGNYTEEDISDAQDLYGRTKYLGEVARPGSLTIRTSIIGRDFLRDSSLVEWFLRQRNEQVHGFRRAVYTGLTTRALAEIMARLLVDFPDLSGVWQIASEPITKHDLLAGLKEALGLPIRIEPDDSFVCDRSLSAARFIAATGLQIPSWGEMIRGLAAESPIYDQWRKQHGSSHR